MAKQISREALQSRYQRNRRAAAHAYIAIARKQQQPVPRRVLRIAGEVDEQERDSGAPLSEKRPA
ncbi:hypothetical protein E7744_02150 [Citricoccus sp. SGAir0253]|uniref:hypothetical protein n=1 Tax=Citricoccus sp. SGAir0253 TaxID=2567881 RepID=UPI0010CD66AF|nr:hypothetical protein [Citricoccus sp. SGAir0253]QCU77151.1 hypothetical protein E7744_02150 [Citricoccus sp. SGAir0253]